MRKHIDVAEAERPFLDGCVDAAPICVSLALLFFSVGALCAQRHDYNFGQTMAMTALIFAAPLQVFIVENGGGLSAVALALAAALINFRFFIMSSALCHRFREVPIARVLAAMPLLSASTFAVSSAKQDAAGPQLFRYYVGVGSAAIVTALLFTAIGFVFPARTNPYLNAIVSMILPLNLVALTGMLWPRWRPVLITVLSFFATPFAAHAIGELQVVMTPVVIAGVFVLITRGGARRR